MLIFSKYSNLDFIKVSNVFSCIITNSSQTKKNKFFYCIAADFFFNTWLIHKTIKNIFIPLTHTPQKQSSLICLWHAYFLAKRKSLCAYKKNMYLVNAGNWTWACRRDIGASNITDHYTTADPHLDTYTWP